MTKPHPQRSEGAPEPAICCCGAEATVLYIRDSEFTEYTKARAVWDAEYAHRLILDLKELFVVPDLVVWHSSCDACVLENGGLYWFNHPKTWKDWASWTAHLMEKEWFVHTNWAETLRRFGA